MNCVRLRSTGHSTELRLTGKVHLTDTSGQDDSGDVDAVPPPPYLLHRPLSPTIVHRETLLTPRWSAPLQPTGLSVVLPDTVKVRPGCSGRAAPHSQGWDAAACPLLLLCWYMAAADTERCGIAIHCVVAACDVR